MATKKDFIVAAYIIHSIKNKRERARMTIKFGREFAAENPRFDYQKWYRACGFVRRPRKYNKGKTRSEESGFFSVDEFFKK